jgi:TolA-binding protein
MLKRLLVLLFICLCVFSLKAQVTNYHFGYGSKFINESEDFVNDGLIKIAEQSIFDVLAKFPDNASGDKSQVLKARIDLLAGNLNIAYGNLGEFIKTRSNSPFLPYAELQRGFIAYEMKKYQDAEIHFESSKIYAESDIEDRGDDIYKMIAHTALYWQGMSLSRQGKHLEAVLPFFTSYSKYPGKPFADDAIYSIGRIYEMISNYDSALVYFRMNSKNFPKSNTSIISLIREANNCLALRQPNSALLALEKAENSLNHIALQDSIGLKFEPQSFISDAREKLLYLKGESYNSLGNYSEAANVFSFFLETYGDSDLSDYVRLGYGWALLNLFKNTEALVQYDAIINKGEEQPSKVRSTAQLYRVIALKREGNRDLAIKELTALSMQPAYPLLGIVLLELGQIHYENGDFDAALKTLERANLETQDATILIRIHLLLGSVYMEKNLWEKAVNEYKRSELLAQNSSEITMPGRKWYIAESNLKEGVALVKTHRAAEAITSIQTFIAESKGDSRMDEALFWLAEAYFKTDLLRNSIDTYNKIIETYPRSVRFEESLYGLGWCYFRLKEFDKSSVVFDQLTNDFPKSKFAVEVLTRQGDGFYLEKKFSKAADFYRKASKLSPGTEEGQYAAYQLSQALYRQGSFEPSITSLLDFVRVYNKSKFAPYALYLIGWIRFQEKKYAESIDNFNFLITAYSQSTLIPRAYYAIGDCYYNIGNFENAITQYKIVIESFPGDGLAPEAIKSIQFCLIALGRESEAIEIANKYVETNPQSPFAPVFQKKIGEMFYQGRKYRDAITEYEKFAEKNPHDESMPEVLYWMAKSHISLNETDKASEIFNKIVKLYPKSEWAPISMLDNGLMNIELANIQKADSLLYSLQLLYPADNNSAQAGFERAGLKYGLGDTLNALDLYRKVASAYPNSDWSDQSSYRIAMHYRANGLYDSAIYYFQIIANVEDNPKISSESQYRIGELWMRQNEYQKAIENFTKVKEKYEGYEDWYSLALLNLGEAYEKTENPDSAREIYNALQAIRPEDDFGKTAKSRLKRIKNK